MYIKARFVINSIVLKILNFETSAAQNLREIILNFKFYSQPLHLTYMCNLASY